MEIATTHRTGRNRTTWRRASIGLCIGLIVSCSPTGPESTNSASRNTVADYRDLQTRNVYSPDIAKDRYVIDQQRRVAQALRLSCEQFKTHCNEAEQAERYIALADARR